MPETDPFCPLPHGPEFAAAANQDRAVDVLANNPARALLYLITALEPEADHTPARLNHRLNMAQGPQPGWRIEPQTHNMAAIYGVKTLGGAGLWHQVAVEGRGDKSVRAFRACPTDLDYRIGVATAALDWELQFPGDLLGRHLGDTRLQGGQSMPAVSLAVYEALGNGSAALTELEARTGYDLRVVDRTIRTLIRGGSIEKLSTFNLAHRLVQLTDPDQLNTGKRMEKGGPAPLIYDTVAKLTRTGKTLVSGEELLQAILADHPELEEQKVRRTLSGSTPACIKFVDGHIFGGKKTSHQIAPTLRAPLNEFVQRIRLLRSDAGFVMAAGKRAREILTNREDVAFLMAKARSEALGEPMDPALLTESPQTATRRRIGSLTLTRFPIQPNWERRAACRDADPELFFPLNDRDPSPGQVAEAKAVCAGCAVRGSCLETAIGLKSPFGVQGGLTPEERSVYRKKPRSIELVTV